MLKTAKNRARNIVENRCEFNGSNTFGRIYTNKYNEEIYVVFSYGYHFPMFAYMDGCWFENSDKYSVSTSKQQTQLRPCNFKDENYYRGEGSRLKTNINETIGRSICR